MGLGIDLTGVTTIVDMLRRRVEAGPSRPLYSWLDDDGREVENWTYAELDSYARAIAGHLQKIGKPGDRALLLYPPGLAFVAAFFGCLYAGRIAVSASLPSRRRPDTRLQSIVQDAQPHYILTTSPILSRKEDIVAKNPELGSLKWLATDKMVLEPHHEWRRLEFKRDDVAFLQYTSGSTSDPKGVMVTHHNLMANQAMIADALYEKIVLNKISASLSETIYVSWLPLFHDLGLLGPIISAVYFGGRSINLAPVTFLRKPILWLEAISRYKGTCTAAPNFAYDLCVRSTTAEERKMLDLSSLHAALNAAEPVRAETLERFADAFEPSGFRPEMYAPSYGLAEATLLVAGGVDHHRRHVSSQALMEGEAVLVAPDDRDARELASCGSAGKETGICIVDPDTLVQCAPGRVGEIWVEGPHISPGYWNKPELTEATFQAHMADTGDGPFLRTGDLGFILDERLFITGRLKELLIIRGKNHYPQDIEHTVETSHPALQSDSSAAFGIDMGSDELLVIAQEVKRHAVQNLDLNEISAAVRTAVAGEHGLALDGLLLVNPLGIPKTTSGKIRRVATRQAFIEGSLDILEQWISDRLANWNQREVGDSEMVDVPPFTLSGDSDVNAAQLRNWVCWRFSRIPKLRDKDLDLARPFAEYGLDSLESVRLVNELAEWSGHSIELAKLWELPTVEDLIAHLASDLSRHMGARAEGDSAQAPARRIDRKEAERLLERIDDLNETEIDQLLAELDEEDSGLN